MSDVRQCDTCNKTIPAPKPWSVVYGWIVVKPSDHKTDLNAWHFCSWQCVTIAAAMRIEK